MRIFRRGKVFEVMNGMTSCGMFPSLDTARDFVHANGEFPVHTRDWKNTAKYYRSSSDIVDQDFEVDKDIVEEAYENYYNPTDC